MEILQGSKSDSGNAFIMSVLLWTLVLKSPQNPFWWRRPLLWQSWGWSQIEGKNTRCPWVQRAPRVKGARRKRLHPQLWGHFSKMCKLDVSPRTSDSWNMGLILALGFRSKTGSFWDIFWILCAVGQCASKLGLCLHSLLESYYLNTSLGLRHFEMLCRLLCKRLQIWDCKRLVYTLDGMHLCGIRALYKRVLKMFGQFLTPPGPQNPGIWHAWFWH